MAQVRVYRNPVQKPACLLRINWQDNHTKMQGSYQIRQITLQLLIVAAQVPQPPYSIYGSCGTSTAASTVFNGDCGTSGFAFIQLLLTESTRIWTEADVSLRTGSASCHIIKRF